MGDVRGIRRGMAWDDRRVTDSPRAVPVAARPVDPLTDLVGRERTDRLTAAARRVSALVGSGTVWQVSSTGTGGGVAEMLRALLGYVVALRVDTRWLVVGGDDRFFELTKRLHNRLHGMPAGAELGAADRGALRQGVRPQRRRHRRPGPLPGVVWPRRRIRV
jgi:hypothetical protein